MDVSKLPTDRLYKFKAVGGLALLIFSLGYTWYSWHTNSLEWYEIEARKGELEVDFNHWSAIMDEGNKAYAAKQNLVSEIELRKNFGPTEPLTEEEKQKIKGNLDALAKEKSIAVADPANVIFMLDSMRESFRDSPSIEEMEGLLKAVSKRLEDMAAQGKDIVELGARIDKLKKEVATNTAKLNYQKRVTWAYTIGSVAAVIFSFRLMRKGFRDWSTAEKQAQNA